MYTSLEAQLHDIFWEAEAPGAELKLLLDHLQGTDAKVLEIGCGSGRILLPLNRAGIRTDGNDISREMLDLLEQQRGEVECLLHCGDAREMELSGYSHFIVPAFTFMLYPEEEVEATLRHLHDVTKAGTSIFFTLFMPWAEICGELEEETWYADHKAVHPNGSKASCRTKFQINRTQQILYRDHKYSLWDRAGKNTTHSSSQTLRWFTHQEMVLLLKVTGWQLEKVIYDLDPSADSVNAHLYTFIAKNQNNSK
jgi:SAM-dependent methyltransferase